VPPALCVTYGSQMRSSRDAAMPQPASCTAISTMSLRSSSVGARRTLTEIGEPGALASTAFNNTFVSARPSASACPGTIGTSSSTAIATVVPSGTALRAQARASSARSTSARGPSGSRPNCAKLRAISSSRCDSVSSTSIVSPSEAGASRRRRAIAKRMGVNGFLISWATCRAASRSAVARSASSARMRPSRSSSAICRIRLRRTTNSGAPLRGGPSGSGSPRPIIPVHPTSSLSGRLRFRLRWPATRDATSPMNNVAARASSAASTGARRVTRNSIWWPRSRPSSSARRCSSSSARCSGVSGADFAAAIAREPVSAIRSIAGVVPSSGSARTTVISHAAVSTMVGISAKPSRMRKRRARKPTCFTGAPYGRAGRKIRDNIPIAPSCNHPRPRPVMRTHTTYRIFETAKRHEIIDITDDVEACRAEADVTEGMILVSAMHISASVFVNDHEPGLWADIQQWLEERIAPWSPDTYGEWDGQRPKRVIFKALGL